MQTNKLAAKVKLVKQSSLKNPFRMFAFNVVRLLAVFAFVLVPSYSAQAQSCYGGCDPASRHPFLGFYIYGTDGVFSYWYAGGDAGGAFALDMANMNTYYHSLPNCNRDLTVTGESARGSAPLGETGGGWRSVYATRTLVASWTGTCYGSWPGTYTNENYSISGICDGGTGGVTGTDDACYCRTGLQWRADLQKCIPKCPPTKTWSSLTNTCVRYGDRFFPKPDENTCPKSNGSWGNPIYPLTGAKRQEVDLKIAIGGQAIKLAYDTEFKLPEATGVPTMLVPSPASFGPMWQTNMHKSLVLQSDSGPGAAYSSVAMQRGGNLWASAAVAGFDSCTPGGAGGGGTSYVATVQPALKLNYLGTAGRLVDARALTVEQYDAIGSLVMMTLAQGGLLTYTYSDSNTAPSVAPVPGLLIAISDDFGRTVQFNYAQPADASASPRVTSVTGPSGESILADYDAFGNLTHLTWPDGKIHTLLYERSDLPWALTGAIDENGARHSTYGYDAQGRAVMTELAGGVNRYEVAYSGGGGPTWSVTEVPMGDLICREHRFVPPTGTTSLRMPSGAINGLNSTSTQGSVGVTAQSQPAGSGCAASSTAQAYDSNGNVSQFDDVNGNRTCFAYDTGRNLRTITVEGLPTATACPVDLSSYVPSGVGSTSQRKTSSQWHPDWELKVKLAEPGRLTTNVYNGQADPFNGNAVASCAPASALLPDGKPIAVLCRQVEQATTDANGSLGFSAALQSGVANRQQSWTYNQYGQVLSARDPRGNTTTYAYYGDLTADHMPGDLASITNAAGHVTQFTSYDRTGRNLRSIDPNGVTTVMTYAPRGWVQTVKVTPAGGGASQVTTYGYDNAGQRTSVQLPDGATLTYSYDAAHRLTGITDAAGNSVTYTLDNSGNRTAEQFKDPSGALARSISRAFDALGRVQSVVGAAQ